MKQFSHRCFKKYVLVPFAALLVVCLLSWHIRTAITISVTVKEKSSGAVLQGANISASDASTSSSPVLASITTTSSKDAASLSVPNVQNYPTTMLWANLATYNTDAYLYCEGGLQSVSSQVFNLVKAGRINQDVLNVTITGNNAPYTVTLEDMTSKVILTQNGIAKGGVASFNLSSTNNYFKIQAWAQSNPSNISQWPFYTTALPTVATISANLTGP